MSRDSVLFLDIDGVLNGHDYDSAAESTRIRPECIAAFNHILCRAAPHIVLSSAWRYMVLGKHLTTMGFEYLLRTHGATGIVGKIIGTTVADEQCTNIKCRFKAKRINPDVNGSHLCEYCGQSSSRGRQIAYWLDNNPRPKRYVVLDDEDYGITDCSHPFVQTKGDKGLTLAKAKQVAKLLRE